MCFRQRPSAKERRVGALSGGHIAFGDRHVGVPDGSSAAVAERGIQHGAEAQGQHRPELSFHAAAALVRETADGRPATETTQTAATAAAAVGQLGRQRRLFGHVQLPEPVVHSRAESGQRHRVRPLDAGHGRMRNV